MSDCGGGTGRLLRLFVVEELVDLLRLFVVEELVDL